MSGTDAGRAISKAYVDLAEGQVHYRVRPGTGTPILLLHQTASSGAMWEKAMRGWDRPNPLYALDTPGFGGSFDPAIVPDMDAYAHWIAAAAQALGFERYHIAGHHTGACIAVALAAHHPARVVSLFLCGPAILTADERARFAAKLGAPFKPGRSGAHLLLTWEYLRVGGANADVDLLHRELVDNLRAWQARAHAYAAAWEQDFASQFAATACPVTVLTARDDILFPYFERARAARAEAREVILEGGANFAPDLMSGEVAAALAAHIDYTAT